MRSVTRPLLFNFRSRIPERDQTFERRGADASALSAHLREYYYNLYSLRVSGIYFRHSRPLSNPARCTLQDYVAKRVPLQLHSVIRHARISRITLASPGRPLSGEYYSCGEISRHATCMFNVRRSFDFKGSHPSISCRNYGVCSRDESSWSATIAARWISVL